MPSALSDSKVAAPTVPVSPTAVTSSSARRASLKVLSRNIDQVVLGDLLFRTWYYSPYPDSIILDENQSSSNTSTTSAMRRSSHSTSSTNANGIVKSSNEHSSTSTSTRPPAQTVPTSCQRLHVCPYCFRYTPKPVAYSQHLRHHNVTYNPYPPAEDPDSINIDTPSSEASEEEGTSTWPVPESAIKVYEHAGYTVWDIDGEREKLYCQNLSLFGKLFLEQKSVFFDTGGFHYFVLTYTPPLPAPKTEATTPPKKATAASTRTTGRRRTLSGASGTASNSVEVSNHAVPEDINLHTRVLGFFSKEILSWDSNNLACILVFPPYQHRNLGQLLMAVSYKLSGWEWEDSIIGGPEKPLSTMGRRSYLRFWSERIARFMMGQTADADGRTVFENVKKRKKVGYSKEEMTVKEIGDRTGMLAEDVVAALNEMEILEVVQPRKKKKKKSDGNEADEEQALSSMIVLRSRVLEWAERGGVDLASPVKEEGFLGEWALSEVEDEDEDDEEVETEAESE